MSFSFLMRSLRKPDLSMCLVFLACLLPTLGSLTLPRKRLLTAESTPLCFLQDLCRKMTKEHDVSNQRTNHSVSKLSRRPLPNTQRTRRSECRREARRANERGFLSYLDALELIRLESPDFVRLLLDNLGLVQRLYCHYFIFNTQSLSKHSFILVPSPFLPCLPINH